MNRTVTLCIQFTAEYIHNGRVRDMQFSKQRSLHDLVRMLFQVHVQQEMLRLEPIGFVFLIMFAGIMVIQFTAMLIHRFGTLSLIIATTELNFFNTKREVEGKPKTNGPRIVRIINVSEISPNIGVYM